MFPAPGLPVTADSWWADAVGGEPETRSVRPATRQRQEEGAFEGGGRFSLSINPLGVIQWQVTPDPPKDLPVDLPTVSTVEEVSKPFLGLLNRWLRSTTCPAASRLAFGVTALLPVDDHTKGYETLASFLHALKIDPHNSSDFLYRINRPRRSVTEIPDLRINRLSTWAVQKLTTVAGLPADPSSSAVIGEQYACSVDLDINTVPTFTGIFTSKDTSAVFSELERLAMEILAKGDVP
ncbi:MAG: hypothetical protein Q7W02_05945 [Candidatus Rokubacteria bacterium]|nr:hypothetical protein [Candidatus Rokubacteria bacterium]